MDRHLTFEVSDALAKKVVGDLKVPYTALDDHTPFDPSRSLDKTEDYSLHTRLLDAKAKSSILQSVADHIGGPKADPVAEIARGISKLQAKIMEQVHRVKESKEEATKKGAKWTGPTDDEIDLAVAKDGWDLAAHCSWLRVILRDRFKIELNSPETKVGGLKVGVSATGELWAKHWYADCVDHCGPWDIWCCNWDSGFKWSRIASVTVKDLKILANSRIKFSVEPNQSIAGRPRFDQLRVDYEILREIPLEDVANLILDKRDEKVQILDGNAFAISIAALDLKYVAEKIELPPTNGSLIVAAQLKKI